jgi:hypothetical protein
MMGALVIDHPPQGRKKKKGRSVGHPFMVMRDACLPSEVTMIMHDDLTLLFTIIDVRVSSVDNHHKALVNVVVYYYPFKIGR